MTIAETAVRHQVLDPDLAQRKASDPSRSVWVKASAGSGKTKVLADRVTRLLLAGVRADKILCLTFTRAAAAEMSVRLTRRLSLWATCPEDVLDRELSSLHGMPPSSHERGAARRLFAQLLSCPGGMRLVTIHGFAQEILRRFPVEAGLPPHFKVMEDMDSQAMWQEVMHETMHAMSMSKEARTARMFAVLSGLMAESTLKDALKEVSGKHHRLKKAVTKAGGLDSLARHMKRVLSLEEDSTRVSLREQAVAETAFARAALTQAARLVVERASDSFKQKAIGVLSWLEAPDENARLEGLDAYIGCFLTTEKVPFLKFANKALVADHPEIEEVFSEEALRLEALVQRCEACVVVEQSEAIFHLSLCATEAYEKRKAERGVLDYNDLIFCTKELLSKDEKAPSWVLYKLDGGIDHMLVDEAQDTGPDQWEIVRILADQFFEGDAAQEACARSLFVVGDEKQSIYSFLNADPETFLEMRNYFAAKIREANQSYEDVPLNISFRSAPAVLKAVDAVLAQDTARKGVCLDVVEHAAYRHQAAGRVEVWPAVLSKNKREKQAQTAACWSLPLAYETAENPAARLAQNIARQIKQWVTRGDSVYDKDTKTTRPIGYGDILILVQKRQALVHYLVRALKDFDIDVAGVDRMKLTEQLAVMDMLALLQFVLLPEDDLTLATVLRGPLIGAQEEDLMTLAIGRTESLWKSLQGHAKRNASYKHWQDYLAKVAAWADQVPPLVMLMRILNTPCPADHISGRRALSTRLGPEAEDPLGELLNVAQAYGATHTPSLQAFVQWLLFAELELKRELEQPEGRVRIVTVHGAKGLEAPVVILPDALTVPSPHKREKLLWHKGGQHELAVPFFLQKKAGHPLLGGLLTQAIERQHEEYRRLLYVAMTRAADRLYIGAHQNTPEKDENEGAGEPITKSGTSWYDLVVGGLAALHQEEAVTARDDVLVPSIVIADYNFVEPPSLDGGVLAVKTPPLPEWARRLPPEEPDPPRPLAPSHSDEEEEARLPTLSPRNKGFTRGKAIHRLLELLPDIPPEKRAAIASQQLLLTEDFSAQGRDELVAEVLDLLNDVRFAPLFGAQSRAEQSVIGMVDGRLISGRVDRLARVGDEIWIIDYKTNRPPPRTIGTLPAVYARQMEAYRRVLKAIYPQQKVRCFLLWTHTLELMEWPDGPTA